MSEHKFAVGQSVQFSPDWLLDKTTEGQYTIVRLFPKVGNLPQYRIKSERDGYERMVLEDRLDRQLGQVTAERISTDTQRQALRIVYKVSHIGMDAGSFLIRRLLGSVSVSLVHFPVLP